MHPAAKFLRDLEDISDVLDTPETEHNGLEMVKATTSEIGVISRIENEGEVVKSSKRPLKSEVLPKQHCKLRNRKTVVLISLVVL
jgi:hypothetical protein